MNYGALSSIPRKTTIGGQPHMLAYINPEEESLIQDYRGNIPPVAGPDGVPAYWSWGESSFNPSNWGGGDTSSSAPAASSNNNDDDDKGAIETFFDNIVEVGSNVISGTVDFVSDVGNAAVDTVTEIVTLGTADTATYNPDATATSTSGTATTDTTATTTSTKSFDDAFAEARAAGLETFTWQGNVYNTNLAPKFYDAMGNEYATLAEAINADEVAALSSTLANTGVSGPYDGGGYFDAFGNEYNSQAAAEAADIMASAESKAGAGAQEVKDYIDRFGTSYLEDRFLTTQINPNTGTYYEPRDTNIVNPLDADTIPYAGSDNTYTNEEIQYFGGDPYSSTVDGVSLNDPFDDPRTEVVETEEDYTGTAPVDEVIDSGAYLADNFGGDDSYQRTRNVRGTRDIMGDFYGGRSGGLWNRFQNSYLTRFNQPTQGIDEMVRVVEAEDGTKLYYGADGALLNPDAVGQIRTGGDPTSLKIGEEDVLIGTQTLDPSGAVISTAYTDAYDMNLDSDILAPNQVFSVTDPATNQLVTFPDQAQYDQFVLANQAALQS